MSIGMLEGLDVSRKKFIERLCALHGYAQGLGKQKGKRRVYFIASNLLGESEKIKLQWQRLNIVQEKRFSGCRHFMQYVDIERETFFSAENFVPLRRCIDLLPLRSTIFLDVGGTFIEPQLDDEGEESLIKKPTRPPKRKAVELEEGGDTASFIEKKWRDLQTSLRESERPASPLPKPMIQA